ncbi:MAG: hypothetical protein K6G28_00240, partial [Acholeplasmatales bacterium]|nr:hypothetical protein [Acholeplasmatales bacterium]
LTSSQVFSIIEDKPNDTNASFKDYVFKSDKAFSLNYDSVTYNFGESLEIKNNTTVVFGESKLTIYQNKSARISATYKNLNVSDFEFDNINNDLNTDFYAFKNMINSIYYDYFRVSNLISDISLFLDGFIYSAIVLILLYVSCGFLNPYLRPKHKINLAIYSQTWFFVILFIENYLSFTYLSILGLVISLICLIRSLSSIKVVKVPKEK